MEWQVIDEETGETRRKFSNETMRKLKQYIDLKKLKKSTEGYDDVLNRLNISIKSSRVREQNELLGDREWLQLQRMNYTQQD